MANSLRRSSVGDLLLVYGAAMAAPALVFVFIPGDLGWAGPTVVIGTACVLSGVVLRRRRSSRVAPADAAQAVERGQPSD